MVLEQLATAVDDIGGLDVERCSGTELGELMGGLRRQIDRLESVFVTWVLRFDQLRAYDDAGASSTVAWLRSRCGFSGGAAAQRVEVARQLSALPDAADLFAKGDLSFSTASVLARTTSEIGPEATALAGASLTDAAKRLGPEQLRTVGMHLRHAVDPDGELAQALRDRARRRFDLSMRLDGMCVVDGLLDAEGGALLRTAIDALCAPVSDDDRTPTQRRADAIAELARRQLQSGDLPTRGGVRPHLMITASSDGAVAGNALRAAELAGVGPLADPILERLSCDAALSTVTVDEKGDALSVGRTRRTTPAALRRALMQRDRGCAWPGCDRPPAWTDSHHIRHWLKGGPTALKNLVLLCGYHHRRAHEGGWRLSLNGGKLAAEPP